MTATHRTDPQADQHSPGDQPPPSTRQRYITPQDALLAAGFGGLLVATWPLLVAANGPGTPLVGILAHVSGMLAGYGVLLLLVMMSRAPLLERDLGADVLARWHSRAGPAVVGLVMVHALTAILAVADARQVDVLTGTGQVLGMPWLPSATVGTLLMLVVAGLSVRAARRRISHERWHGMHLLMYVAVALGFAHQLAGPDLAGHRWLQVLWALAYCHVFGLVLTHRVLTPLRQANRHRMRVAEVRPEGPGVVSIIIEGQHLDELQAESGQFFRWRFLTPDHWSTAHPFSLSAAPRPDRLRLTVKELGDGSRRLQALDVGTWVVTEGPYGAVTAGRRNRANVLLIAGGVGITPMRALFETMPVAPGQDLLLLYFARTDDDVLFRHELEALAKDQSRRVRFIVGDGTPLSADLLHQLVPALRDRDVYFCGPPGMAIATRHALTTAQLPAEQFHEERFGF